MLCLAFDTATPWGRFALARDGEPLAYQPHNVMGSYADALLPVMETLLSEQNLQLGDVDALAVTRGPGSFTGVRIGVAMSKALAYALDVPLTAVSTLEAMAAAMFLEHAEREWAVPSLDARRGEVYAGVFRRRGDWVEAVEAQAGRSVDQWWERVVAAVPDPDAPCYAGSGTPLLLGEGEALRPELQAKGEPVLRSWSAGHPATAPALALAASLASSPLDPIDPFALTPLYLRASDAEVQRGLDLTPDDAQEGLAVMEDRRPGKEAE
jgi:tRNA threonylcarbamoyladenosine biosynthesis protein TsaB